MRKKFLLMTFLLAIIGFCGTNLSAENTAGVAKVGNTEYATIDEAIAAWTNGTTLTLLADVTLSDVIQLSSTEYHILDLGSYTMTAASKKDAIQIVNNGRSSASYALDIKADATNPGGITASGKTVVRTTGKSGVKDRPIIRFYNGVFNSSYIVYHSGSNGTNCPQFQFHGGVFYGTIYTNRTLNQFYGGIFYGSLMMSVDSSAYTLIAGGTFKQLSNLYMSALNSSKFTIGSAKGVYDKEVYIDDNGNYVIAAAEPSQGFQADVAKNPGTNDYLAYSKVATDGQLGYTDVYTAINNNKSGTITVYKEELDLNNTGFTGTIVVPADRTITITNAPEGLKVTDVEGNTITPNANGTYTTVEPAGNNFTGYTGEDAIWGEVWGNAYESFVIKVLDANGNVMGTTNLNNIGGIIDGDVNVTWNLKLDAESNTDEYWTMEWTTAPTIDNMPAKVELWVDGVKVSGGNVVLNGPDNLNPIYAAVTDADGKILAYHTNVQDAIVAAAPDGTVEILSDVTVDEWIMFSETLNIGSGQIITMSINGLTINGNGKTVTIKDIESAGNGDRLFSDATELNINNWTINYANGVAGGIGLTNGTIEGVTFIGGTYGVFPGADNVTVTGCTFKTNGTAIYFEQERDGLVVTNNTFELPADANVILLRGDVEFTDNTVISGRTVNVVSGSPEVTGNDFNDVRFKVYNAATATIENNEINVLAFNEESVVLSTFGVNTLSTEAQAVLDAASFPVAQIGATKYGTLAEAVAAAQDKDVIEIIKEGNYTLPEFAGKELTFKGSSTITSITDWVNKGSQGMMGSTVHFENLTISGQTENYYGLFHTNAVTYKDCIINGLRFLYSPTTFEGCEFKAEGVEHSFWTYGASNVTVTDCIFKYTDRAVNCYSENGANHELDITFTGCTFTYEGTNTTPEGAVEINSSLVKSIDLVMNGCTAPENGKMWFNSQWDPKHGANTVVEVDGVVVWTAPAKIGETRYATLQEAVDAAQDGEEIDLLKDVELTSTLLLTKNNILDGNDFMLTPAEGFTYDGNNAVIVLAANMSGYEANRTYIVKNLTIEGFSTPSRIVRANFCDATIQNCLFNNNTSESIITSAYAVLNVEDNTFTNNTASFAVINVGSDVSDGTNLVAKIIDNTFEDNQAAIAGIFLASSADVTDNHFKNNTHTGDNANAAAILAGPYTGNMAYTVNINRNAFENAMSKGGTALPSVFAEDWSSLGSTTSFDLSLNYWDGNEPEAGTAYKTSGDNPQVTVKSYYTTYTDEILGGLIEYPQGNDFTGYTRGDAIWGEVWGNAKESFVIKVLDANGDVMGTTILNNVDGIINGNVNVTWSLKLDAASNTDEYWTMNWTTAPSIGNMPAKVELWVDGVKVSGGNVVLNGPDEIQKIYAAVTDAEGKILSYHTSIAAAVAAITNTRSNPQGYIALLRDTDEAITLPAGITLNLNGFRADNIVIPVASVNGTSYATLAEAVVAVQEGQTIQLLAGEISEGTIKLPATLKNVTFKGAADHASVLKDMTIMAADGNSFNYEGLTFDGIVFENSRISITGWRTGDATVKDLAVTNCVFKDLYDTTNSAPLHINMDASEAVNGLTFTDNVINGATGGSKSGVYAQTTGVVVFTGNIINNVSFRPYVIQLTTDDGIDDEFTVTGNTFSGSAVGRAQGLGNNAEGTDAVSLKISNNIFEDITNAQQICYWNFNEETTTAVLEKNYYDIDIEANPGKIYFNSAAQDAYDLLDMGIFPIYTELNADGTINTESEYTPNIPFAQIGETGYPSLEAAAAAAQAGDEILLLANVTLSEELTTPADITLNGNGKQINGTINAGGALTIKGRTKVTNFGAGSGDVITIGEGACLEMNGTGRMVIGHGATFNITGTITDAKNANVADLTPSLIMPGASFTGAGVTFNVTNAYISAPSSYCSSSKSASGTFVFKFDNSIWESAGKLAFESQSTAATVNFELKDSKLTTGSHLVFGVSRGEVVFDNSNVNVGTSRQIENQSTMTVKNGSVVNGAVATSSNAKNPGTLIVDNATYAVTGEFSGSDLGTGTIVYKNGATISAGSITKADIQIDATGMIVGDVVNITANLNGHTGAIEVINDNMLDAKIVDGKIVIVERTLQGEGTADNPYLIKDISDLEFFRDQVNAGNTYAGKYIKLNADIDLAPTRSESNWTPIGNSTNKFQGTFDGDNHTISDLVITGYNSNVGFFGFTTNGEIKNVIFENAKVSGRLNVGVVAGTPYTSKYTNIKVTGHVEVNGMAYVGGVGGKNAYANWTDITVNVDGTSYVKANSVEDGTAYRTYVGGVVGFNGEGSHTFKNITSNIKVIGSTKDVGGIFGIAHYGNNFENVTCTGDIEAAEGAKEVGGIAGVWNNTHGYTVTMTNCEYKDATITIGDVDVTATNAFVGGAYNSNNETASTSGSLIINGETVYPYVAKIGEVGYNTLAKAVTAAQDEETIQLLWAQGDDPIAMNASLYGKDVTITGTATVDWSKGWLFVGRGGAGDAILTFDNANLTSASNSASTGIHVSGSKKDNVDNTYYGTVIINNSTIELDYLINKGNVTLDNNSTLTVKNGFAVGGRPASETESGADATATMTLNNGSKVVVNNHNGMGLGYEAIGIMNINSGSTFECTQSFLVTAKGTMNVNGGNVKVDGTLTNNGEDAINVNEGESTLNITTLTGKSINLNEGAIVKNSTVGGAAYVAGNVLFRGDNTFAMITDYGDYYSSTTPSMWTVEAGASLTLTKTDRYGLGYGDKVTVYGEIEDALTARESLTDADASVNMYGGLVGMTNSASPDANNVFKAEDAYLIFGVNGDKSFGNKSGDYYGNYDIDFTNCVVTANGFKFYEDKGNSDVYFNNSDLLVNGVLMTNDASSKFTFENSVVLSKATSNGTDDKNQNAGVLTLVNTTMTYNAAFTNVGTLNIGESSTFTAPSVVNNGTINFTAPSAKLVAQEGLEINLALDNPEYYEIEYADRTYSVKQVIFEQTQTLSSGWNWFSSYINLNSNEGLETLQNALGTNGIEIKSHYDGYVRYTTLSEPYNISYWSGNLSAVAAEQMYMIRTSAQVDDMKLVGEMVDYNNVSITLKPGWNWIGYPTDKNVDINEALKNLNPIVGDEIKTQDNGYAQYVYDEQHQVAYWNGSLNTLIAGEGYKYYSSADDIVSFKYNISSDRGELKANVTTDGNHWTPNAGQYPNNMTMTAMVEVEGGDYEVAAFVNGECRGSARPIYIEAMDAHILFLTIHGEDVEEMTFRYYDLATGEEFDLNDRMNYSNDAIVGTIAEPYIFSRGTTGIGEASLSEVNIYPNPTTTGTEINLQATCDTVEVFNALGVKVAEYHNVDSLDAFETAGIYVIRLTNNGDVKHCRLIVK